MYKVIIILLLILPMINNVNGCMPFGVSNCDCQTSPQCNECLSKTYYYNYDQSPMAHQQYSYPTLIESSNTLPPPPQYEVNNNINQEPIIEYNFPEMNNYLTTLSYKIPEKNTSEYFEADKILANSIKKINNEDAYRHAQEIISSSTTDIGTENDLTSSFKIETTSSPQDSAMNYPTADLSTSVNTGFAITVENRNNNSKETYNTFYENKNKINSGNTLPDLSTISPIPYDSKDEIYKIKHESHTKESEIPLQTLYYGYKSYPITKSSDIKIESNFTFKNQMNTICNGVVISKSQEPSLVVALDKCYLFNCSGMNIKNISSESSTKIISFLEVVYLSKIDDKMSLQGYSCFTNISTQRNKNSLDDIERITNKNKIMEENNKKVIKTSEIILNNNEGIKPTKIIGNGDPNVSSYGYNISPKNKKQLEKASGEEKNNGINEQTTLSPKQQRQLRRLSKAFGLKTSRISIVSPDGIRRMVHPKYINYENIKRII